MSLIYFYNKESIKDKIISIFINTCNPISLLYIELECYFYWYKEAVSNKIYF